jgi:pantoate--beta-alanine ligase
MFMKTVESIIDLHQSRAKLPSPVGLVPTMGFLHEGHLSLVRRARKECASIVVTIFVNPTQFAPQEDFKVYPRDIPRDLRLLEDIGVDLTWLPLQEEMYLPGFQTWVNVDKVTKPLEGAKRPRHFRGVTTIVSKLFNAVQPHSAYFGQKDAQQVIVIRRMVKDLNYPIEIIVCPTVRESDGLAMSSRNEYLNPQEREAADVLFKALSIAASAFENGIREAKELRNIMTSTIQGEPLASMEYTSCADPETLEELSGAIDRALLSTAVMIGTTRLIDNILLGD